MKNRSALEITQKNIYPSALIALVARYFDGS